MSLGCARSPRSADPNDGLRSVDTLPVAVASQTTGVLPAAVANLRKYVRKAGDSVAELTSEPVVLSDPAGDARKGPGEARGHAGLLASVDSQRIGGGCQQRPMESRLVAGIARATPGLALPEYHLMEVLLRQG